MARVWQAVAVPIVVPDWLLWTLDILIWVLAVVAIALRKRWPCQPDRFRFRCGLLRPVVHLWPEAPPRVTLGARTGGRVGGGRGRASAFVLRRGG